MKSKLFVEAAKLIDSEQGTEFSCNAIGYSKGGNVSYVHCDEISFYLNLFQIPQCSTFKGMFGDAFRTYPTVSELREIRILALLLAGEVVKSEKKSFEKSAFGAKFKQPEEYK